MPLPDTNRLYAGFSVLDGGVDMQTDPSLLSDNQCAFSSNLSFRGDLPVTRDPWLSIPLNTQLTGKFQGVSFYETQGLQGIIISVDGRLYLIQVNPSDLGLITEITPRLPIVTTAQFVVPGIGTLVVVPVVDEAVFSIGQNIIINSGSYTVTNRFTDKLELQYNGGSASSPVPKGVAVLDNGSNQIIETQVNPVTLDFVHIFQAESYAIVLAFQQKTIIYDGAKSRLSGINEIPSGILGLYAWGRLWIVLSDLRSFVAGNIVNGDTLTTADILSFTENDFLNEGGFFSAPSNSGPITSVLALATIDTALGIGPILFGTPNSVFSCNAPVDRTVWKNLSYPIQTISLLEYGPLGPRSTISVNNDMWYRAIDGDRSFKIARRAMSELGNTPQSYEVGPILAQDDETLLFHSSKMLFNNRVYSTVAPRRTKWGVVHDGLTVINYDPLSSLRVKEPPIWEGVNSGLTVHQLVKGRIDGEERAFAIVRNETSGAIELWELLKEGYHDTFKSVTGNDTTLVRTSIKTALETKRYVLGRLTKLVMAELYLDDMVDTVSLTVKFRPDQYPDWITWQTLSLCSSVSQCTIAAPGQFTCTVWKPNARTYAARLKIPRPPESCNTITSIPLDSGYEFQFRIEGTGHYRLRKFKPHFRIQSDSMEGECPTEVVCTTFPHCETPLFDYHIART